jgi:uncharacterized membrane-anchored protein
MGVNLIKKQWKVYSAVVLQLVILLVVASSFYLTDIFGKEVRLKTEPVDPTDLFYGDYVILQYDIQTLPLKLWEGNNPIKEHKRVYVVLKEEGNVYEAKAIYPDKPKVSKDEVVMVGRFEYLQDHANVYLTYGVEKYYIKEGTGKAIEDQRDNLIVKVAIAPWGQKRINGLMFQKK